MDCDKKYIKMCEKSPLRDEWEPVYGDYIAGEWYIDQKENIGFVPLGIVLNYKKNKQLINVGGDIHWYKKAVIPLFRQDQLQKMIIDKEICGCISLIGVSHLMLKKLNHYIFDSFEQLWHAFVVKEKFDKEWDNKKGKWVLK